MHRKGLAKQESDSLMWQARKSRVGVRTQKALIVGALRTVRRDGKSYSCSNRLKTNIDSTALPLPSLTLYYQFISRHNLGPPS